MTPYQVILLATDLHQIPGELECRAKQIQQLLQAKLVLIHAIEPIAAYGYPGVTEITSPLIDCARQRLAELGEYLQVAPQHQHLVMDSVKQAILNFVSHTTVDLLIIGSHGRHGWSKLLGSSAHAVVSHVPCDVLTIYSHPK